MNQNDCNLGGDSDSNDVVSSTVLNTGNNNNTIVDDNDLFNTANLNQDQANLLAAAVVGAGNTTTNGASFLSDDEELPHFLREQDRFLPIANVAKLMKKAIPERGKIAKEAKECVQECVSEFISFITSEAAERCSLEKRKTINGEDILFAMSNLGFDNYVEPLKIYLTKYRESNKINDTSRLNSNDYNHATINDIDHQQQQHNMHHQINY